MRELRVPSHKGRGNLLKGALGQPKTQRVHGCIQAAYLEVVIGGPLWITTIVVQIKQLANLYQTLLLIFCFVWILLGANGGKKIWTRKHKHEKRRPWAQDISPPPDETHMDCLGQAGNLLYKMSRKHTIRIWNF